MTRSNDTQTIESLQKVFEHTKQLLLEKPDDALPGPEIVQQVVQKLVPALRDSGISIDAAVDHLLELTQGFSNSSLSSTYYGFVTGGVTPYAKLADILASVHDQNVQVHLPDQSIVTNIEDRALTMLLELIDFDSKEWKGRTLTTGATAGNIQGLACGREWVLQQRLGEGMSVGELGLLEACANAGVHEIKVLSTAPHSSLGKAASIVGLGRRSCIEVRKVQSPQEIRFDLDRLEQELKVKGRACIVAISCGEVNTGNHATYSHGEVLALRRLCDKYKAWLHVDGAFGIFSRLLRNSGQAYDTVSGGGAGMELADSLSGDLHKFLNVPYDCGFFACRHPKIQKDVYQNAGAAYLKAGNEDVVSPLNIGAENSRRFRGFAVYSTLIGLGRQGYVGILQSQVDLARNIAKLIKRLPAYILHNGDWEQKTPDSEDLGDIATIVLFGAKDDDLNARLVEKINSQKIIYVSGTSWEGRPACRIAISNWQIEAERDLEAVKTVLETAAQLA